MKQSSSVCIGHVLFILSQLFLDMALVKINAICFASSSFQDFAVALLDLF